MEAHYNGDRPLVRTYEIMIVFHNFTLQVLNLLYWARMSGCLDNEVNQILLLFPMKHTLEKDKL